jgi:hypothetical protein
MLDPQQALAAAARAPLPTKAVPRRTLVIGAGGALGTAVLEQLLATHAFERVGALVEQAITPAHARFFALHEPQIAAFAADTVLVVFDRQRHAHGREAAFVRPEPAALPALAARLHDAGARRLIVVVPHAASLLPMALQHGLASLDEAAVAALGFDQLLFMRMAQVVRDAPWLPAPQRLARWMLSQLRWMIPQREQPVRVQTVARVAAALALQLAGARAATRVVPAALLWRAAQGGDVGALVAAWLEGRADAG